MSNLTTVRSDPNTTRLIRWCRNLFHKKDKQPVRFELRQLGGGGDGRVADMDDFVGKSPEDIINEIYSLAEDDCQAFRGLVKYAVVAYADDGPYISRQFFAIEGRGTESDSIEESESPNEKGQMSQVLRHNEAYARLGLSAANSIMHTLTRAIERKDEQLNKMMDQHFKVIEAYESLMDKSYERQLALREQEKNEHLKEQLVEKLGVFIPVLAKKFLPQGEDSAVAGEEHLLSLIGSLTEEQIGTLAQVLKPEQSASFVELYKTYAAKAALKEAEKESKKE